MLHAAESGLSPFAAISGPSIPKLGPGIIVLLVCPGFSLRGTWFWRDPSGLSTSRLENWRNPAGFI